MSFFFNEITTRNLRKFGAIKNFVNDFKKQIRAELVHSSIALRA